MIYHVMQEPRGETYLGLITYSLRECTFFQLVNPGFEFSPRANRVLAKLERHLVELNLVDSWPGTVLGGGGLSTATSYLFLLCEESATVLKESAQGVYDWVCPELPEDLALLRADKRPWFYSVAHEKESYFDLDRLEYTKLTSAVRALGPLVDHETLAKRTGRQRPV